MKGHDPRRNIKGRPPVLPSIDKLLAEVLGDESSGIPAAKILLNALYRKALDGDVRAVEALLDRAYGKAKASMDVTSNGQKIEGFGSISEAFWADAKKDAKS